MLAPVLDLDEGPRAPRAASERRDGDAARRLDVTHVDLRVPALVEIVEEIDQPVLLLVANDQVHARNPRHGLRVGLRIAARDHEERVGIVPRDAANRLAIREVGAPGDRAGIDHVDLRALVPGGGPEAAPLEQGQDLLRFHLVEAAPERGDGDGPGFRHAGTASRSWPQAAPMSSPLLHLTVAMMPCSRR